MSKGSFLTRVEGFTPVIDVLVDELGLMPALVYGTVWRYCQMKDSVCKASLGKLAKRVGISYNTALRHIKTLCDKGYLEDTTPNLRYAPHVYVDTGKAKILNLISAVVDNE